MFTLTLLFLQAVLEYACTFSSFMVLEEVQAQPEMVRMIVVVPVIVLTRIIVEVIVRVIIFVIVRVVINNSNKRVV